MHGRSIENLTHGDNVCLRFVHLNIIFSSPAYANVCPGLENAVSFPELFPFAHEHLEVCDSTQ